MEQPQLNWIANFIWGIADDVLRDLYVRGKYRDVILPMTVLRRLDAALEPTKEAVLDMKASLDKAGITNQDAALRQAAGEATNRAFYNTSKFTLRDLRARASQQQLRADFEAYLDGFSPNVQEILDNFEFRNQIPRLSKADALGTLIEKFLDPSINLSPNPVLNPDGSVKHPGLDNHAMGTIFEELLRRFNEENNEEAGEHWTPRDAVKLMARLIFLPVAEQIESSTYLLYDGACGTVRFVAAIDRRIRRYIRAKQKLITLLEEQKQAIIHRAVTRGLDSNVRLKPSGSSWFPEVPCHWQVLPLRRLIRQAVDGPHHSPDYLDSGIPFISARNVEVDRWSLRNAKFISNEDYDQFSKRVVPEPGDVLYTKGGTTGIARVVDLDFPFQVWVHIAVLKVKHSAIDPRFLALVLNSPLCYEQSQLHTRGATITG